VLADRVSRLASLGPRDVNQLAFPAFCVDAMAAIRTPLATFYDKFREDGASMDAMAMGCALMLDLMAIGKWQQAEQLGAEGLDMAERIQEVLIRHYFLTNLGVLAAWQGDLDAARRYAAELTEWAQPRSLGLFLEFALRITVLVALAEADFETAYQAAVSICPPERLPPFSYQVSAGMLDFVEAAVNTGRIDEARTHVAVATRLRIAEVSPRAEALIIAVSAMTAPDPEAGELYESALIHPGLADYPFEYARITLAHGMWLRRKRRHTEARAALTLAAKKFEHLGARPWVDRAHSEFRAADAPGNRAVDRNAPLSPQERRIAGLAATGATTKQIAVQLTVSPRTVDAHMRNVFAKLGITSRAALSEALRQRDSE
jgi:DNA-binding CsgD family transcriptional regulator